MKPRIPSVEMKQPHLKQALLDDIAERQKFFASPFISQADPKIVDYLVELAKFKSKIESVTNLQALSPECLHKIRMLVVNPPVLVSAASAKVTAKKILQEKMKDRGDDSSHLFILALHELLDQLYENPKAFAGQIEQLINILQRITDTEFSVIDDNGLRKELGILLADISEIPGREEYLDYLAFHLTVYLLGQRPVLPAEFIPLAKPTNPARLIKYTSLSVCSFYSHSVAIEDEKQPEKILRRSQ